MKPAWQTWLFHAPLRREEDARRRLDALCSKNDDLGGLHRSVGDDRLIGGQGAIKRWRSLDAVYSGRWKDVEHPHSQIYGRQVFGVTLYPWRVVAPDLSGLWQEWFDGAV